MKILVINAGSSSLKYQLIDMDKKEVLAKGNYERIGEEEAFLTHKVNNLKDVFKKGVKTHKEALEIILDKLVDPKYNVVSSLQEINAVGHRIVHGGELFSGSCLVDDEVIEKIKKCAVFAPLHNPAAVNVILACREIMKDIPMVTVFDTAFHQTIPEVNFLYPIPKKYYTDYRIRKYGAHGTSHKYVCDRLSDVLNEDLNNLKVISCHLGQGASISAVKDGKCFDTSMGLTPLGGFPMVTRSGDLDPSVVTYIMEKEGITPSEMESVLNKKSGISAICEMAPDFRQIENMSHENKETKIAIDMFAEKVAEYIARYASSMYGVDAVIFTGGIGENQIGVRSEICKHLEFMGVKIDEEKNNIKGEETKISTDDSKVKVYVIPTDEEMMIAIDTLRLVTKG